jgi:hypothetical protein
MPPKPKSHRPAASQRQPSPPPSATPEFEGIRALAASLNEHHRQMAADCAPLVQSIIKSRSRDHQHLEQLLDRLLDCACIPEGLVLFRTLCRYYFTLNPAATADYIGAYREMWDNEHTEELAGSTEKETAK